MDIDSYLNEHENKSLLRVLTCGSVDDEIYTHRTPPL